MKTVRTLSGIQPKRALPKTLKSKRFSRYFFPSFLAITLGVSSLLWWQNKPDTSGQLSAELNPAAAATAEAAPKPKTFTEYIVQEKDIPAEIFSQHAGYDNNDMSALLSAATEVYDLTHLTIGKNIRFYFEDEVDKKRATRVEYYKDTETIIAVKRTGDNFSVQQESIQYQVNKKTAKGTIGNFFYVDALEAGLQEATILDVGDIFSSAIDFTTEIQQGDSFAFVYEERSRDGSRQSDGKILAAKFVNAGETHFAYYFEHDGEGQYYDADGHVIQRQFLKAPLTYRYISSGFTGARMHPITKTVHAHYQIDYAAPTGTPVVATANGTVTSAQFEGGWGNIVRLTHQNGYTTHYAHLSGYAAGLKTGNQVKQGEIIGYVGNTGWSTGPHLDYGMKLNGNPLNPLELKQPKGERLPDSAMTSFEALKTEYNSSLE